MAQFCDMIVISAGSVEEKIDIEAEEVIHPYIWHLGTLVCTMGPQGIVRSCYPRNGYELSAKACDVIFYAQSIDAYQQV